MSPATTLRFIKLSHTLIWALLAGCILAVPITTFTGHLRVSAMLLTVVGVEVMVLAFNRWSCPLTGVAARYTDHRSPNFDIYLPRWLARHNKSIFGTLFVLGGLYTLISWLMRHGGS